MKLIFPEENGCFKYQKYFNSQLIEPLALAMQSLRNEAEYDLDTDSIHTALDFVARFLDAFGDNKYLLVAGADIASKTSYRTKRGVLYKQQELKRMKHEEFEVAALDSSKSRLGALVDLNAAQSRATCMLNSIYTLIVFSSLNFDKTLILVRPWLNTKNSVLPFDFDQISSNLNVAETTAIIRYFPADNGSDEAIICIGNAQYIKTKIRRSFESIATV